MSIAYYAPTDPITRIDITKHGKEASAGAEMCSVTVYLGGHTKLPLGINHRRNISALLKLLVGDLVAEAFHSETATAGRVLVLYRPWDDLPDTLLAGTGGLISKMDLLKACNTVASVRDN